MAEQISMADQTTPAPDELYGAQALDQHGQPLGTIDGVYLDAETGTPEWAAVRTGRAETTLVPLAGAAKTEGGVRLALDERLVRGAPHGGEGALPTEVSPEQEAELYHYYALEYSAGRTAQLWRAGEAESEATGDRIGAAGGAGT